MGILTENGLSHTIERIVNLLKGKSNAGHKHGNEDITSLDAGKITSGTISIDRLPQGALERLTIVTDDAARFKLTSSNVQQGDTVKVTATGKMYYVVDETKLSSEAGYETYAAGTAASVPWSGVTNKPSTYTPSSHNHTKSEITDFPTSMKNPNSLTISLNGTSQCAYDGSTTKSIDVTPSSIGAATNNHTHTKSQVGLSNVDNTADSEKSVKYATSAGSSNNSTTVNGHTVNADVPSGAKFTDTVYTHPTMSGNKHIPSGGSSGQILKWSSDGTATWGNEESASLATTTSNGLMSSTQFKNLKDLISTNISAMGTSLPGTYGRILKLSSPINGSGNDAYGIGIDTDGRLYGYFGNNGSTTAAWKALLLKSEMSLSNIYITSLLLGSMTLKGNWDGDAPQTTVASNGNSITLCIIPKSSGSADVCWIDCYIDSNNRTKVRLKNTVSGDKTFTPSVYVIYKTPLS